MGVKQEQIFLMVQLEIKTNVNRKKAPEILWLGKKQPALITITNMIRYEAICHCRLAINNSGCPLKTASNSITAGFVAQQIKLP